jgi:hypothetical protein
MLLKITGLACKEEKTKKKDKQEGTNENNKEEAKLHYLKTPLLEQSHRRRGRFLQINLQQGRRCVLISPSWRPHLRRMISVWSVEIWRILPRTSCRYMERSRMRYMEGSRRN